MGRSLPPGLMIKAGKWVWSTMWQVMMSQMAPRSASGAYMRPESHFRHWIGETDFPAAAGRYCLI
ncbi:MAG: glutathione S-transferase family protein, partial [Cyanobacteria bacterium P01_C01_bin.73]